MLSSTRHNTSRSRLESLNDLSPNSSKRLMETLLSKEQSHHTHLVSETESKDAIYRKQTTKKAVKGSVPLGFGSTVARDARPASHPSLDPAGLYCTKALGNDPCLYRPKPLANTCKQAKRKDPWRCKVELENWAKNLGYRNQAVLKKRRWQQSIGGPAWTVIGPEVKYESPCKNVGFGRTPRFKTSHDQSIPGPGTYYTEVPYKVPYGPHSKRPTFEREEPCRFKDKTPTWSLAPNNYRIMDRESIAYKPFKIVSLRGPYDLFTGQRNASSIKNHFATARCMAATWPLALPGCLEKYKKNKQFGVMNKTNMSVPPSNRIAVNDPGACKRRAADPGPANYSVLPVIRKFKQNMYGFNSSYDKPRMYMRCIVWPGVGNYHFKMKPSIPGHGHRHVFRSKVGRTIGSYPPQQLNSF